MILEPLTGAGAGRSRAACPPCGPRAEQGGARSARAGRPYAAVRRVSGALLPSLVRAGLLGQVMKTDAGFYRTAWTDQAGITETAEFTTERAAVTHVARHATGGLRFHDLGHSYATWLVTDGVPVNIVQRVMGHEQASTTLNRYTHTPADYAARVLEVFGSSADDPLTFRPSEVSDDDPDAGD